MHDLLIIRHGQSAWNLEGRWQGWLDSPLTELGVSQAYDRAAALVDAGFAPPLVHCSDLGRARRTGEIIAAALGAELRADPGFRERSGGDWEGHTVGEIEERWPGMRDQWRRGEIATPPGGELDTKVMTRFDAALAVAIAAGTPTMVVTHGGALRLVATQAGVDVTALTPNLGGYWFEVEGTNLKHPVAVEHLAAETATTTE